MSISIHVFHMSWNDAHCGLWILVNTSHYFPAVHTFWCRIHLWFRLMGGLQTKSMTSQRNRATHTRWRICVTMATLWQQQDGGYMLLWKRYGNNKMAAMRIMSLILHLQQYSHRLNLLYFFIFSFIFYTMCMPFSMYISSIYIFIFTHPQKARLWDLSIRPPTSITFS